MHTISKRSETLTKIASGCRTVSSSEVCNEIVKHLHAADVWARLAVPWHQNKSSCQHVPCTVHIAFDCDAWSMSIYNKASPEMRDVHECALIHAMLGSVGAAIRGECRDRRRGAPVRRSAVGTRCGSKIRCTQKIRSTMHLNGSRSESTRPRSSVSCSISELHVRVHRKLSRETFHRDPNSADDGPKHQRINLRSMTIETQPNLCSEGAMTLTHGSADRTRPFVEMMSRVRDASRTYVNTPFAMGGDLQTCMEEASFRLIALSSCPRLSTRVLNVYSPIRVCMYNVRRPIRRSPASSSIQRAAWRPPASRATGGSLVHCPYVVGELCSTTVQPCTTRM